MHEKTQTSESDAAGKKQSGSAATGRSKMTRLKNVVTPDNRGKSRVGLNGVGVPASSGGGSGGGGGGGGATAAAATTRAKRTRLDVQQELSRMCASWEPPWGLLRRGGSASLAWCTAGSSTDTRSQTSSWAWFSARRACRSRSLASRRCVRLGHTVLYVLFL